MTDFGLEAVSFIATGLTLAGVYYLGTPWRRLEGWAFAGGGNMMWLVYAASTGQIGLGILNAILFALAARGIINEKE